MIIAEGIPKRMRHYLVRLIVYGITGSTAVFLSQLLLSTLLGLEGSLRSGPWSFRVTYLILIPPSYSMVLVAVGTLFGQRAYFARRVMRIWGRPLKMIGVGSQSGGLKQPRDQ